MAKADFWKVTDAETRKLGEQTGLETRVVLAVNDARWLHSPAFWRGGCGEANALSEPPGEYGRKAETQRNWRGDTQLVDHVV